MQTIPLLSLTAELRVATSTVYAWMDKLSFKPSRARPKSGKKYHRAYVTPEQAAKLRLLAKVHHGEL